MQQSESVLTFSAVHEAVIKTLLYYDIFNYPLTSSEVHRYCSISESESDINQALTDLVHEGHVFRFDHLYSLHNDPDSITRRLAGNHTASEMLPVAQRQARLIAKFPFVRAVMASGSLSKGYMDNDSDLDFFIVTEPGKLWIARTLLVLYKRLFLGNSHKRFCVNYFVDEAHLTIEEKNLFTATELATVIPLVSYSTYTDLHANNSWLKKFFPNYQVRTSETEVALKRGFVTGAMEKLLSPLAVPLDRLGMWMTFNRWRRLYKNYPQDDFEIAFKTKKHVSKVHPRHFQKSVLERYHDKLVQFRLATGTALL